MRALQIKWIMKMLIKAEDESLHNGDGSILEKWLGNNTKNDIYYIKSNSGIKNNSDGNNYNNNKQIEKKNFITNKAKKQSKIDSATFNVVKPTDLLALRKKQKEKEQRMERMLTRREFLSSGIQNNKRKRQAQTSGDDDYVSTPVISERAVVGLQSDVKDDTNINDSEEADNQPNCSVETALETSKIQHDTCLEGSSKLPLLDVKSGQKEEQEQQQEEEEEEEEEEKSFFAVTTPTSVNPSQLIKPMLTPVPTPTTHKNKVREHDAADTSNVQDDSMTGKGKTDMDLIALPESAHEINRMNDNFLKKRNGATSSSRALLPEIDNDNQRNNNKVQKFIFVP